MIIIKNEADVKRVVKLWMDQHNCWSFAPVSNGMGQHGIPDRLAACPLVVTPEMVGKTVALFLAVESKRPGRRAEKNMGLSAHQVLRMNEINAAGGIAHRCDGYEDLAELDMRIGALTGFRLT